MPDVCPKFGLCGGCTYDIGYDQELKLKEDFIFEILAEKVGVELYNSIYNGIVPSPMPLEYRNKMEFSFGDECKGGVLTLGMHKKRSFYDIMDASTCIIVDEDIRQIVQKTTAFFRERGIAYYHKRRQEGYLRHLLVRKAAFTKQIMVVLVTVSGFDTDIVKEWTEEICGIKFNGDLISVLHTVNDRNSDVVEDQGTTIMYGRDYITETLLGLNFKITPFSFFQTNSYGAEKLYDVLRKLVPETGTIYDLYSGTGTIAQIISPKAQKVVGVEIVPEASKAAEENARLNGINNTQFICGDVLKTLDEINVLPDMIVLDPPREGVVPKALDKILAYGVNQILYVSCKATSLKRDMDKIFAFGYKPSFIQLVDLFPRTGNVETVVLFDK